jgi:hypothetical protein
MNDLRAERRAYVVQLVEKFSEDFDYVVHKIPYAFAAVDAIIQHDLDNPPAWATVKESLTVGWVKSSERLPTEADAPSGWIHVSSLDFTDKAIMRAARRWTYWHPAVGPYQIPEPPYPLEKPR